MNCRKRIKKIKLYSKFQGHVIFDLDVVYICCCCCMVFLLLMSLYRCIELNRLSIMYEYDFEYAFTVIIIANPNAFNEHLNVYFVPHTEKGLLYVENYLSAFEFPSVHILCV